MYIYLAVSFCVKKAFIVISLGLEFGAGQLGGGVPLLNRRKNGVADTGSVLH